MRIVFLGTPDFAIPTLNALVSSHHTILAVITQPDREGNRRKIISPPVKILAQSYNIPVYQFENLRKEGEAVISALAPDIMVTVAYGQIISRQILAIPKYGTFNVHGSLLPKYRGASPVQQAMICGDTVTGVTIMRTEYEVDSGDIVLQRQIDIERNDTAKSLLEKMSHLGANALIDAIKSVEDGTVTYTKQLHNHATFCKMITKKDGLITKDTPVNLAEIMVRAYNPWPIAYVVVRGERLRIWDAEIINDEIKNEFNQVGKLYENEHMLVLALKDGALKLNNVQGEGGKNMISKDYLLGHNIIGEVIID